MDNNDDWGAKPLIANGTGNGAEDTPGEDKIPAETVWFKMRGSNGEEVDVNLLQAINQLFIDMGHFDRRVRELEGDAPESPLIKI